MAKLELVKGNEAIMKNIKSIETKGKALDALIHLTACSILMHVHEHREVSLVNKLVQAMPKSSRRNALIEWFETFGEMQYDTKDKEFKFQKDSATRINEAEALPFWEFKPEPAYHAIDLKAALAKLVKQASDRQKEIEEKKQTDPDYSTPDKIDTDVLEAIKKLIPE